MKLSKNYLLLILLFLFVISIGKPIYADFPANSITLNDYDITTKTFSSATGTDSGSYKSIVIMSTTDNTGTISLPTVSGYEYKSDLSTAYSKVVNIPSGKTAKTIAEEYIRNITFLNGDTDDLKISISLSSTETTCNTFYFSENDHYYQYIPFNGTVKTWIEAYNLAKSYTYQGRTGYLATVTSLNEDLFIYNASGGAVGWLGGTTLNHGTLNGQYYDSFETTGTNNWYWACGPEIGQEFYDRYTNSPVASATELHNIHQSNFNNHYHNWSYEGGGSPASADTNGEPNNNGSETCLTTLPFGYGFATNDILPVGGIYPGPDGNDNCYGTYSWNNIPYDSPGNNAWSSKGYIVEYGNSNPGDTNTSDISANYISVSATISLVSVNIPTAVSGLAYNGLPQTGVASGTGYTITNNSATDVGSYIATATLEAGYIWSDGTLTPKNISWSIINPSTPDPTPSHSESKSSRYSIPNTGVK